MTLRITVLGPPRVEVDGRPLVVDTRKAIALLAYLAIVGRPIARDSLVELLWPDAQSEGGRGALRRTLSTLRAGLGGRWLEVDRRQVSIATDGLDVDVSRFRADARSDDRVALTRAVDLFRGEFLEGFSLRDSVAFDEWQSLEAQALAHELAGALRALTELEEAAGRLPEAIAAARRLVAIDGLDEAAHRTLMRLHAETGDQAAAIRQYREVVRILDADLGVEPARETTELYESLVAAGRGRAAALRHVQGPPPGGAPVEGLDPPARTLLEAAAVLGETVDLDLVEAVAGTSDEETASGIEVLIGTGVLIEGESGADDDGYRIADVAAVRTVADRLGLARRRLLHRRAAAVLEARFDRRAPDAALVARIARHLEAAGRRREAADAHVLAGAAARRASDHGEAATHYRAALELGHPDRQGLHEAIGDVETLRGRYGEALAAYEQGAALAGPEQVAGFELRLGSLHLRRGAMELADLHLAAGLARLGDDPSVPRARALADRSLVALRLGQIATARRLAHRSLREAASIGDAAAQAQALNLLAILARHDGDLAGARRHLRRSLDRGALADQPGARVAALNNLALVERAAGNLETALELTDEALRQCTILGDRHREGALRNNRADLLHALGRPTEAAEELVRSVTALAGVGDPGRLDPEIWKLVEW